MDDIYDITPEEEEDIKFHEKCEALKHEAPMKNGYCIGCMHYDQIHDKCRIGVDLSEECEDYETNDNYFDSDY